MFASAPESADGLTFSILAFEATQRLRLCENVVKLCQCFVGRNRPVVVDHPFVLGCVSSATPQRFPKGHVVAGTPYSAGNPLSCFCKWFAKVAFEANRSIARRSAELKEHDLWRCDHTFKATLVPRKPMTGGVASRYGAGQAGVTAVRIHHFSRLERRRDARRPRQRVHGRRQEGRQDG